MMIALLPAVVAALSAGCESPESAHAFADLPAPEETAAARRGYLSPGEGYEGPWVPDISGEWNGSYFFDSYGDKAADRPAAAKRTGTPITAVVAFNDTNHTHVTVTTSLQGRAHYLYGRMDAAGNMRMTDAYDGETWTAYNRRAATNLVELNDIVLEDERGQGTSRGLRTVLLDEHLPKAEEDVSYFGS